MSKKSTPPLIEDKVAVREALRLEKAARLPPIPTEGGAYVVGPGGELVREGFETPEKEA